jgi:hypothetical protein
VACVGQFDDALRRRREAELSRAQLQQKIEAFKERRSRHSLPQPAADGGAAGTPSTRAAAEAAHRRDMLRKDAEDQVRGPFCCHVCPGDTISDSVTRTVGKIAVVAKQQWNYCAVFVSIKEWLIICPYASH